MQNMSDVLAEHQSIMLENFEAIYISTNGTVPFMSQSFIAASAILCLFMPNDRSLWDSSWNFEFFFKQDSSHKNFREKLSV